MKKISWIFNHPNIQAFMTPGCPGSTQGSTVAWIARSLCLGTLSTPPFLLEGLNFLVLRSLHTAREM